MLCVRVNQQLKLNVYFYISLTCAINFHTYRFDHVTCKNRRVPRAERNQEKIAKKTEEMEQQNDCSIQRGQPIRRYPNDYKAEGPSSSCTYLVRQELKQYNVYTFVTGTWRDAITCITIPGKHASFL